jgi:phage terminase small subunit
MPLTDKQQRFVAEYLVDSNATQAAIRAGYSAHTASSQGERLLRNVEVAAAIEAKQTKTLAKLEITAERVMEELGRIAFADPRRLFNDDGSLKKVSELSADDAAVLAQFDVIQLPHGETVRRLRVWDKAVALQVLAKRFGLLKEKVEISFAGDLADRLARARQRVKK